MGRRVPARLLTETMIDLRERFGAASCETQTIRGQWQHQGAVYQGKDECALGSPCCMDIYSSHSLLAVDRKPDLKAGFPRPGFKFNFASMTVADDAIANDQPKAGASADRFGGEKRFEH